MHYCTGHQCWGGNFQGIDFTYKQKPTEQTYLISKGNALGGPIYVIQNKGELSSFHVLACWFGQLHWHQLKYIWPEEVISYSFYKAYTLSHLKQLYAHSIWHDCNCRTLWTNCVKGAKHRPSGRATSALNCWAITPAPDIVLKTTNLLVVLGQVITVSMDDCKYSWGKIGVLKSFSQQWALDSLSVEGNLFLWN